MIPAGADVDRDRPALGVQQPWAELIVRGIKTLEIRSQPTRQRGTIYIYASKRPSPLAAAIEAMQRHRMKMESLSFGLLVGTVEIVGCRPCRAGDRKGSCIPAEFLKGQFAWELAAPRAFATPIPVRFLPYGVWFYPFKRRASGECRG